MHKAGMVDVNYEPKMKIKHTKVPHFVRMDPTSTVKINKRKVEDCCTKGVGKCRHSNIRAAA